MSGSHDDLITYSEDALLVSPFDWNKMVVVLSNLKTLVEGLNISQSIGLGEADGTDANSSRTAISKRTLILSPTSIGVNNFYGFTGLVNETEYTILNNGSVLAEITESTGVSVHFQIPSGEAKKIIYYGSSQYLIT